MTDGPDLTALCGVNVQLDSEGTSCLAPCTHGPESWLLHVCAELSTGVKDAETQPGNWNWFPFSYFWGWGNLSKFPLSPRLFASILTPLHLEELLASLLNSPEKGEVVLGPERACVLGCRVAGSFPIAVCCAVSWV